MLDPIIKRIEVPCNQKKAFTVFVDEMHTWWPLGKFTTSAMAGAPAVGISIDKVPGGKITELGAGGRETHWGTVKSYDPYGAFSMDFHIPRPDYEVGPMSLVEVTFTEMDSQRTMVELKQTNWEVFADMAEGVRGGYNAGWGMIFEGAYKEACGG